MGCWVRARCTSPQLGRSCPVWGAMSSDSVLLAVQENVRLELEQRVGVRWVGGADKGPMIIHAFQSIHPSCPSRSRSWGETPGCWLPPSRPCRAGLACWAAAAANWGPWSAASWRQMQLMAHMI